MDLQTKHSITLYVAVTGRKHTLFLPPFDLFFWLYNVITQLVSKKAENWFLVTRGGSRWDLGGGGGSDELIFGQQNPSLTKILASRVMLKGAFTYLGKIWDPQIGSWLWLATGKYPWKWAWFQQSGHGFNFSAHTSHTFEQIEPP